ncbi:MULTISPECIES: hypothetical protein [Eikenella]|nr:MULTISPECIES: hypothetical protein [Eikenella]
MKTVGFWCKSHLRTPVERHILVLTVSRIILRFQVAFVAAEIEMKI